jgi:hypothetical protein
MPRPIRKGEVFVVERHALESLVIYEVSEHELEELERETKSVGEDFSFALAGVSIGTSLASVLLTVDIQSNRTFMAFFGVMILGFVVTLYCGVKWLRGRRRFKGVVQRIKSRVGPLGEEGKEIEPEQLETLTPAEANK